MARRETVIATKLGAGPGSGLVAALFAALVLTLPLAGAAGAAQADAEAPQQAQQPQQSQQSAVFAGGCFWCMEPPFDELPGVVSTTSGYIGGEVASPTYRQVAAGGTGHAEAVRVVYDPQQVTYARLLDAFWRNVDPLDGGGQFCDRGNQYRTAIFYENEQQKRLAEQSKQELAASGRFERPIVTEITPAIRFYPAEDYHQDYYEKNPIRYKFYRYRCGRDDRLEELWGEAGATG